MTTDEILLNAAAGPVRATKTAREQRELARAITAMAGRMSASARRAGLAFNAASGSLMGKTHEQWSAAADRQFRAVQRLTAALCDAGVVGAI